MKNILNHILTIIPILFIFIGCSNIDYQKIVINNDKKTISLLNSSFVIDSVLIRKFGKPKFTAGLKNKSLGSNFIDLYYPNSEYRIYHDSLSFLSGSDDNLGLLIFIRKKGSNVKITEDIESGLEVNPDIQRLYIKYLPYSKGIDTLETDGYYK